MTERFARLCFGLFAALVSIAMWGCAGSAKASSAVGDRANAWTVPGVLRIETSSIPETLNPIFAQEAVDTDVAMFWAGHFFNWSDDGRLIPELAVEVPTTHNGGISRDGRTIVYHLRRGVTWQDGAPFDARDVVFTWHAIMNPRNDVPVRQGYDQIDRIDAPDPYTVVVHLRHPYAPFINTFFSMSNTSYAVLPQHLLAQYSSLNQVPYNHMPIGTGPFRVVYADGHMVKMAANRSYWRGLPQLKEVDFRWQSDDGRILDDLREHRIDFYYGAKEHQEPALHGIPGTTIFLYPFNSFTDIGFNTASPLVSDKRVRQALAYATDRAQLLARVANGVNQAADTDQPPLSWAQANDVRHYAFDPNRARALLEAAGWRRGPNGVRVKDGRPLRIEIVTDDTSATETLRLIRADWRAVGVDSAVRFADSAMLDAPAADGGIESLGKFDAVLEGWANGVDPDDSSQFMCSMRPPAGWNIYRYCNPTLDRAEAAELSTYDQSARCADFYRIQHILSEDVPMIVLSFQQQQDVVNLDLKNYYPAKAVTPFWNTWQLEI